MILKLVMQHYCYFYIACQLVSNFKRDTKVSSFLQRLRIHISPTFFLPINYVIDQDENRGPRFGTIEKMAASTFLARFGSRLGSGLASGLGWVGSIPVP